jgi:hypothetical protein
MWLWYSLQVGVRKHPAMLLIYRSWGEYRLSRAKSTFISAFQSDLLLISSLYSKLLFSGPIWLFLVFAHHIHYDSSCNSFSSTHAQTLFLALAPSTTTFVVLSVSFYLLHPSKHLSFVAPSYSTSQVSVSKTHTHTHTHTHVFFSTFPFFLYPRMHSQNRSWRLLSRLFLSNTHTRAHTYTHVFFSTLTLIPPIVLTITRTIVPPFMLTIIWECGQNCDVTVVFSSSRRALPPTHVTDLSVVRGISSVQSKVHIHLRFSIRSPPHLPYSFQTVVISPNLAVAGFAGSVQSDLQWHDL